jgi:hypothetical protein
MKIFFFMGCNPKNKSGVSWKIWKIERRKRRVVTWWGPASIVKRKVVGTGELQSRERILNSETAAAEFEGSLIRSKMAKGYERGTRRRP